MNKLDEICAHKRTEVARRKAVQPLEEMHRIALEQPGPRGFHQALKARSREEFGLIAEIKKASPSKGLIREDFHPAQHAQAYEAGGATCLSVLTDMEYFQGHDDYLRMARAAVSLPALRKDFMIDPWQIVESRVLGADAVLLIVAALDPVMLQEMEDAATALGMDVLVEVHDEAEFEVAMTLRSRLIGINNRNLKTFKTDLATTERIASLAPDDVTLVAESGINSHSDCKRLAASGAHCFLVGESLMRQADIEHATRKLLEG